MQFIHVQNDSDQSIHIFSKNNLEKIIEMKEKYYYYINSNLHDLITQKFMKDSELNMLKLNKTNQVLINLFVVFDMINNTDRINF